MKIWNQNCTKVLGNRDKEHWNYCTGPGGRTSGLHDASLPLAGLSFLGEAQAVEGSLDAGQRREQGGRGCNPR